MGKPLLNFLGKKSGCGKPELRTPCRIFLGEILIKSELLAAALRYRLTAAPHRNYPINTK
jgi:hypothetical protein